MKTRKSALGLAAWIALCFVAAAIGGRLTATSVDGWYDTLRKPAWNPPKWVFAPVWSALYLMMAVAAWLVWRQPGTRRSRVPLVLFAVQLGLNVGWSALFFGLRSPGAAAIEIVVLWVAILATTVAFWRLQRLAGLLLLPYLAWVAFAAALTVAIWRLAA
jgi:tryptophan-rich sensory protein